MNWDRIAGNWKQFTDDQLDVVAGRRDLLLGRIQELYGTSETK
jgi:uncharacterized protein YjbJ (UPF0337 family)